jgi:hypothetical protein
VGGVLDAVSDLREAVREFLAGDAPSPDRVLSSVFALNNEIGAVLRRTGDPVLRDLQLKVNAVTVAAKSGDMRKLSASMSAVLDAAASFGELGR